MRPCFIFAEKEVEKNLKGDAKQKLTKDQIVLHTSCDFYFHCRFITILYYLNDVEEGGETAFPVANAENYNHTVCII